MKKTIYRIAVMGLCLVLAFGFMPNSIEKGTFAATKTKTITVKSKMYTAYAVIDSDCYMTKVIKASTENTPSPPSKPTVFEVAQATSKAGVPSEGAFFADVLSHCHSERM
jgi:hypothetical protein